MFVSFSITHIATDNLVVCLGVWNYRGYKFKELKNEQERTTYLQGPGSSSGDHE